MYEYLTKTQGGVMFQEFACIFICLWCPVEKLRKLNEK
jgi:hypothetical protein